MDRRDAGAARIGEKLFSLASSASWRFLFF
jgi:hypothetical protein